MPEYENQHFISKFYLRNFIDVNASKRGDNPPIWILENNKGLPFKKGIKKLGKKYYYSIFELDGNMNHFIEKGFSKIETALAKIFEKITESSKDFEKLDNLFAENFTEEDFSNLYLFMELQIKKVPKFKKIIQKKIEQEFSSFKKVQQFVISDTDEHTKRNLINWFMLNAGTQTEMNFLDSLINRNLSILISENNFFITSDNPVVRLNPKGFNGLGLLDTEIYFPLTPRCLLLLHGEGRKIQFCKPSAQHIDDINLQIALQSDEFIFSCNKESLEKIKNNLLKINVDK